MNLSTNFADHELGISAWTEPRIRYNAKFICEQLLEPIRAHYNKPLIVHDGYRPAADNTLVGGKPNSWHLYQDGHAAADIHVDQVPMTELFRWVRLESKLKFDKVILEHSFDGIPRCVHLQVDVELPSRRLAYVGLTGDGKNYTPVEVA